jgi:hypothetical protein
MIAAYVSPVALDQATYEKVGQRLDEAGAPIAGRAHHSCFGEPGNLMVYEVWESQKPTTPSLLFSCRFSPKRV